MKTKHTPSVFLLGGYDLEMVTIKQLLDGREDCIVFDKHLNWSNAKLSQYENELTSYSRTGHTVYGIELEEDIPATGTYVRIDHHNDFQEKPTSLEQILAIAGIEPNRHLLLVAANDRGYIPAMLALGATHEEIVHIRARDRECQGISAEDEQLATQSIADHLSHVGRLSVVYSSTSHFSPICDRLYPYESLLIYTDTEWMFYGKGKKTLSIELGREIEHRKIVHGGGDEGFIGSIKGAFTKEEIHQFVNQITQQYDHI